jgi:3-hydroxymyristoyl/3-hydroxydecanoyl-(acyl carrier protein) dehydratase
MRETVMNKLTLRIAANHPTGAGHFPGNPIIPGALLLAEVLRCIEQAERARYVSCNVKSAKFHHPARPGDTIDIEYEFSAQGTIEFQCAVAGIKVLSGGIVAGA